MNFAASKVKRTLFEPQNRAENTLPAKDLPGPGKYEPVEAAHKKQFNSSGNASIFLSKVPNCKDTKIKGTDLPGPGFYDSKMVKHGDRSTIGSVRAASTDESNMNSQLNPFLSGTGRGDMWRNKINAPYTKASFLQNPGPGQYFCNKKKDDIKQRLLQEETVTVPFGASDSRACNKRINNPNPGPGSYIDINNPNTSSVCKSLSKI